MALGEISTIAKIPFIATDELSRGGFISSTMFYVDKTWRCWLPVGGADQVIEMKAWPAEAYYWGDRRADPHDIEFNFLNFIAQRANSAHAKAGFSGIQDDIFNLSASLHKIELLHNNGGPGASRLAATEVEYFLTLCRSIFDLLQEILAGTWKTITLIGPEGEIDPLARKRQIGKSFADMALKGSFTRSATELTERYGLPPPISQCYERHAVLFEKIRKFRDDIVHRGYDVRTIFHTETGFAIHRRFGPFDLDIWRTDEVMENDIAPLLPALGLLLYGTLSACDDFMNTLAGHIKFPPPVVPGLALMARGYFNGALMQTLQDAETRISSGVVLLKSNVALP